MGNINLFGFYGERDEIKDNRNERKLDGIVARVDNEVQSIENFFKKRETTSEGRGETTGKTLIEILDEEKNKLSKETEHSKLPGHSKTTDPTDHPGHPGLYFALRLRKSMKEIQSYIKEEHLMYQESLRDNENILHVGILSLQEGKEFQLLCKHIERHSHLIPGLLQKRVKLKARRGTPIMGELPLFIAALFFSRDKFERILELENKYKSQEKSPDKAGYLLEEEIGREKRSHATLCCFQGRTRKGHQKTHKQFPALTMKNSKGDTVIHCLIRYASFNRDKIGQVIEMITYLHEMISKKEEPEKHMFTCDLFRSENKKGFTPLELATKKGIPEVFAHLLSLKGIYLRGDQNDGIYQRKVYDISEIDTKTNMKHGTSEVRDGQTCGFLQSIRPASESIMEIMYGNHILNSTAVEIVKSSDLMRFLISRKWEKYRLCFFTWLLLYMVVLILVTLFASFRIDYFFKGGDNVTISFTSIRGNSEQRFVVVIFWLVVIVDVVGIFLVGLLSFSRLLRPNASRYLTHNLDYVVMFSAYVICLFVDIVCIGTGKPESYQGEALVLSVVFGWLFATIFLRPFARFGRLIDLVRMVLVRDVLGFAFAFLIILTGFSIGFHDLYKYKNDEDSGTSILVEDHNRLWSTMFTLFNVMLGLSELNSETSSIFDTRVPSLAIFLYIVFIVITYALLFNALIAIMTNSCGSIFSDIFDNQKVHKLSVMLFMEELFGLNYLFRNSLFIHDPNCESLSSGEDKAKKYNDTRLGKSDKTRYLVELKIQYQETEELQLGSGKVRSISRGRPSRGKITFKAAVERIIRKMREEAFKRDLTGMISAQNEKVVLPLHDNLASIQSEVKSLKEEIERAVESLNSLADHLHDFSNVNETNVVHTIETVCPNCNTKQEVQRQENKVKFGSHLDVTCNFQEKDEEKKEHTVTDKRQS